jgi:hypothetical protein
MDSNPAAAAPGAGNVQLRIRFSSDGKDKPTIYFESVTGLPMGGPTLTAEHQGMHSGKRRRLEPDGSQKKAAFLFFIRPDEKTWQAPANL